MVAVRSNTGLIPQFTRPPNHRYTDISHFRAPYKNWPSLGADAGPIAAPGPFATEADGVRVYNPELLPGIIALLGAYSVIFLDNDSVQLDPVLQGAPDIRQNAVVWVNQQLGAGKTVVLQSPSGATAAISPGAVVRFLRSGKGRAFEREATGGVTPIGAIVARPAGAPDAGGGVSRAGMLGPIGVVAAVLAVGGIAYYVVSKRKKSHRGD